MAKPGNTRMGLVCEVYLWGKRVGALLETASREIFFEFDPLFHKHKLNISPLMLPLDNHGSINF